MTHPERKRGRAQRPPSPPTDAVSKVREVLNLTQEQMAREMSCSLSSVRVMEKKRRLPGSHALKENFERLAGRAGVPLQNE